MTSISLILHYLMSFSQLTLYNIGSVQRIPSTGYNAFNF